MRKKGRIIVIFPYARRPNFKNILLSQYYESEGRQYHADSNNILNYLITTGVLI